MQHNRSIAGTRTEDRIAHVLSENRARRCLEGVVFEAMALNRPIKLGSDMTQLLQISVMKDALTSTSQSLGLAGHAASHYNPGLSFEETDAELALNLLDSLMFVLFVGPAHADALGQRLSSGQVRGRPVKARNDDKEVGGLLKKKLVEEENAGNSEGESAEDSAGVDE